MGLFMNQNHHPGLFKNSEQIHEPNQAILRRNYLSELLHSHEEEYSSLLNSLNQLKENGQNQDLRFAEQWSSIREQLYVIVQKQHRQHEFEQQTVDTIKALDEKGNQLENLFNKDLLLKQAVEKQIHLISEENKELSKRMEQVEEVNEDLSHKIEKQDIRQQDFIANASAQQELQKEVLSRLHKQEALTEKMSRQIYSISSLLFERANLLSKKIDKGYKATTSYIINKIINTSHPLPLYLNKPEKEENQNE